jgi:hypothetical protein
MQMRIFKGETKDKSLYHLNNEFVEYPKGTEVFAIDNVWETPAHGFVKKGISGSLKRNKDLVCIIIDKRYSTMDRKNIKAKSEIKIYDPKIFEGVE